MTDFKSAFAYQEQLPTIHGLVGVSNSGVPMYLDLTEARAHAVIFGKRGTGKETLVHSILASTMLRTTPDKLDICYIDQAGLSGKLYENNPFFANDGVISIHSEKDISTETEQYLKKIEKIVKLRVQSFYGQTKTEPKQKLIIINEFLPLVQGNSNILSALIAIAKLGHLTGVHLLLVSSTADKRLPKKLMPLINTVLSFAVETKAEYDRITGGIKGVSLEKITELGLVYFDEKFWHVPAISINDVEQINTDLINQYKTEKELSNNDFQRLLKHKNVEPVVKMLLGESSPNDVSIDSQELKQSEFISLDNRFPHVSLFGQSGIGKTALLENMIISAMLNTTPDKLQFVLIDGKGNSFSAFEHNPFVKQRTVDATPKYGLELVKTTINNVKNLVKDRIAEFKNLNVSGIVEYNEIYKDPMPEIVLVIDEFSALIKQDQPAENQSLIVDDLEYILKMSRSVGVHLVLSNQSAKRSDVAGKISANLVGHNLAMKLSMPTEYENYLLPKASNHLQVLSNEEATGQLIYNNKKIKVPYLTDDEVFKYNQQIIEKYI